MKFSEYAPNLSEKPEICFYCGEESLYYLIEDVPWCLDCDNPVGKLRLEFSLSKVLRYLTHKGKITEADADEFLSHYGEEKLNQEAFHLYLYSNPATVVVKALEEYAPHHFGQDIIWVK